MHFSIYIYIYVYRVDLLRTISAVCVRDPGKKRIEFGAQGFLDLWISIGLGPGTQGRGLERKLLEKSLYVDRHMYI